MVAADPAVLARLARVEVPVSGAVDGLRRAMKVLRNACARRGVQRPAWRDVAAFAALGGDGVARGVMHHPGLSFGTVADALSRLGWRVTAFRRDSTPGDVAKWVEGAVMAAGCVEDEVTRDVVIQRGGFRALVARKGW